MSNIILTILSQSVLPVECLLCFSLGKRASCDTENGQSINSHADQLTAGGSFTKTH